MEWSGDREDFSYQTYTRNHSWSFEGGSRVEASAAPKKRYVVDYYTDDAVGFMEKNTEGKLAITRVVLRP